MGGLMGSVPEKWIKMLMTQILGNCYHSNYLNNKQIKERERKSKETWW
jgi:hypothetical protein